MQRFISFILIFGILLSIIIFEAKKEKSQENNEANVAMNDEIFIKAIWLSQFDMHRVYSENGKQRSVDEYSTLVDNIVTNIDELGFNTVFIQLRPNGDSIYPSNIFPPSKYVCGSYSNSFDYDPLDIFLKKAKAHNLSVHGWINPLRCMSESEIIKIDHNYLLYDWYKEEKNIVKVNGKYYLEPAYAEVREYVCSGIKEILTNYDLDGIQIDDYFYPTTDKEFDKKSYSEYQKSGGKLSLSDFRRNNINLLIKDIYKAVKETKSEAIFGVSPSGNNKRNYEELYADVSLWCKESGYIDYICPQIYFGFEHTTHSFDQICDEFSNMVTADNVDLYIGITLDKAALGSDGIQDTYAGNGKYEWIENKNIIARSLMYCDNTNNCDGIAIFSYQHFFDAETNSENKKTAEEIENLLPVLKSLGE